MRCHRHLPGWAKVRREAQIVRPIATDRYSGVSITDTGWVVSFVSHWVSSAPTRGGGSDRLRMDRRGQLWPSPWAAQRLSRHSVHLDGKIRREGVRRSHSNRFCPDILDTSHHCVASKNTIKLNGLIWGINDQIDCSPSAPRGLDPFALERDGPMVHFNFSHGAGTRRPNLGD